MFGLGGKLAMGMGMALLVLAGTFYWYYESSQKEIKQLVANNATLEANVATLEGSIKTQNETIVRLETTRATDQTRMLELSSQSQEARNEVNRLRNIFSRHNLNRLSLAKPGLIERIINRGTAKVGAEFVEITTPRKEVLKPKPEEEKESDDEE